MNQVEAVRSALRELGDVSNQKMAEFIRANYGVVVKPQIVPILKATIKDECSKFSSGPWYAVLLGQGGMTRGVVLYDSLETLNRIKQEDLTEEENARLTAALAVIFGSKKDLVASDQEAIRQYHWKVASGKAYPSVYRKEPGLSMRPPLAWELELMEGCLRAVPDFVSRRRQDDPAKEEVAMPVASGELTLGLSWVVENT